MTTRSLRRRIEKRREERLEKEARETFEKVVERARDGDEQAMDLLLDFDDTLNDIFRSDDRIGDDRR